MYNNYDDEQDEAGFLVCVRIPDLRSQMRVIVNPNDTVYSAKQIVLSKLTQELPLEPSNYGLYLIGKPGKFLDEAWLLSDYSVQEITQLELRYKRRNFSTHHTLTEKAISKANSKSNQKKLIDLIVNGSVKKVDKLLDSGLDPNYIYEDGNTPLGIACGRNSRVECIPPLIAGDAHIDFRGSGELTPIHRAAIGGNVQAIKILLSHGASPNSFDAKGLTPLYHSAIMGDDIAVCETLLKHGTKIGIIDHIGWTELHQIAKHGNVHLIDIMLIYGADIDAQNNAGNTALHVAAQHGQLEAAIQLMKRGADRMIVNSSKQPPNQVAILCGHRQLAKEILNFRDTEIEILGGFMVPTAQQPTQSSITQQGKKRSTFSKLKLGSSMENLLDDKKLSTTHYQRNAYTIPRKAPLPNKVVDIGTGESEGYYGSGGGEYESAGSTPTGSQTSQSQSPVNSQKLSTKHRYSDSRIKKQSTPPSSSFPTVYSSSPRSVSSIRERLYACKSAGKKYIVTRDISPKQEGDLVLTKGMEIEVLYIGKAGYWEGKTAQEQGWFPQNAITVCSPDKESHLKNPKSVTPQSIPDVLEKPEHDRSNGLENQVESENQSKSSQSSNAVKSRSGIKSLEIRKGPKGFGFAMRGIKAVNISAFKPNPHVPALQYVGNVDVGGAADSAGLQQGDFIIEVNGRNTTRCTHEEVVSIIKQSSEILKMKVIVPVEKPKSKSGNKSLDSSASDLSMMTIDDPNTLHFENSDSEKDNKVGKLPESPTLPPHTTIKEEWNLSQEEDTKQERREIEEKNQITSESSVASLKSKKSNRKEMLSHSSPSRNRSTLMTPSSKYSPEPQRISVELKERSQSLPPTFPQLKSQTQEVETKSDEQLNVQESDKKNLYLTKSKKSKSPSSSPKISRKKKVDIKRTKKNQGSNQSPLVQSRTYDKTRELYEKGDSSPAIKYKLAVAQVEMMVIREQEAYEKHLKDEDEEQSLFARQLRKASLDHFNRISSDKPELTEFLREDLQGEEKDDHNTMSSTVVSDTEMSNNSLFAGAMQKNVENGDDEISDGWRFTDVPSTNWRDLPTSLDTNIGKTFSSLPKHNEGKKGTSPKAIKVQPKTWFDGNKHQKSPVQSQGKMSPSNHELLPLEKKTVSPKLLNHTKDITPETANLGEQCPRIEAESRQNPKSSPNSKIIEKKKPPPSTKPKPFIKGESVLSKRNVPLPSPESTKKSQTSLNSERGDVLHNTPYSDPDFISPKTVSQSPDLPVKISSEKNDDINGETYKLGVESLTTVHHSQTSQDIVVDSVTFPVLSLRNKFENLAKNQKVYTDRPLKQELSPKCQPLSSKNRLEELDSSTFNDNSELPVTNNNSNSSLTEYSSILHMNHTDQQESITTEEESNLTFEFIVPPPFLDNMNDDNNRMSITSEDFPDLSPPSEIIDEDNTMFENEDVILPPPLIEDMKDTGVMPFSLNSSDFDGNEPEILPPPYLEDFLEEDNENEIPPPIFEDSNFNSVVPSVKESDLLDDIVGQLKSLVEHSKARDRESDESDQDIPPPLPSCPPPDLESHDESEGEEEGKNKLIEEYLPLDTEQKLLTSYQGHDDIKEFESEEDITVTHDGMSDFVLHFEDLPPPLTPPEMDDVEDTEENMLDLPPPPLYPLDDEEGSEYELDIIPIPPPIEILEDNEVANTGAQLTDTYEDTDNNRSPTETNTPSEIIPNPDNILSTTLPLDMWSVDDVCIWLKEIGLGMHVQIFKDNEILGEHLSDLSKDDLKDLGICKIGHIKTFKQKLEQLRF